MFVKEIGEILYTNAAPTSSAECNKEFGKILTLLGSMDPALRFEALWIRKNFRVHQDEIVDHAYW